MNHSITDELKELATEYYDLCRSFKLTHYIEQKLLSKSFKLGEEMSAKKPKPIQANKHKQVKIQFERYTAMVDSGISDLILNCWKLGIHTLNSCQGQISGNAYIQFASAIDAECFMNHAAKYSKNKNSMYSRMRHSHDDGNYSNLKSQRWEYTLRDPKDLGITEFFDEGKVGHNFDGEHDFSFALAIHFPVSDLEEVKNNIQEIVSARFGANLVKELEKETSELEEFVDSQRNKSLGA